MSSVLPLIAYKKPEMKRNFKMQLLYTSAANCALYISVKIVTVNYFEGNLLINFSEIDQTLNGN